MRRLLIGTAVVLGGIGLLLGLAIGALYYGISNPGGDPLPMPEGLVSLESTEGRRLLDEAVAQADEYLVTGLVSQEKATWCGVASAVMVLHAFDIEVDQAGLFTPEAEAVRSELQVTFTGTTLPDLAGLIRAHGLSAQATFASDASEDAFRSVVARNLADPRDQIVVNYDRAVVGEEGGGHISPLAAYHDDRDMVLLVDTTTWKYPPHWVPVAGLYEAMNTVDPETGRTRGWVETRR